MKRLFIFLLSLSLIATLPGCGRRGDRLAGQSQARLAEAELLLDARSYPDAEDEIEKALKILNPLITDYPENPDYRLIRARAYFMYFMAKNTLVIENAPIQKGSLVKVPSPEDLVDYDATAQKGIDDLTYILNNDIKLTSSQKAILYSSLAAFYRLTADKTEEAQMAYEKAYPAYQSWLKELRDESDLMNPKDIAIQRLKNQIRDLQMSHAELYLLEKEWEKALEKLKDAMAGDDLKYFSLHFERYLSRLDELERKIAEDARERKDSREERLKNKINFAKSKRSFTPLEEVARSNPYEAEMMQIRLNLADTQNNLMYRMICYYNLEERGSFEEARKVLNQFFPELEARVTSLLNEYQL